MKDIYKDEDFEIPEGVSINVKARLVTIKGPRGELTKSLRHINMEIKKVNERKIKLIVWRGGRKHVACLRTVRSLIVNMIQGVTNVLTTPPHLQSIILPPNLDHLPCHVLLLYPSHLSCSLHSLFSGPFRWRLTHRACATKCGMSTLTSQSTSTSSTTAKQSKYETF